MAAISCRIFQPILKIPNAEGFWWFRGSCLRFYAVYPQNFKNPTIGREKLHEKLKKYSEKQILSRSVKPASSTQSCSVFYNQDVQNLINCIMKNGDRQTAREVVEGAFTRIKHIQIRKYNSETDPEKKRDILLRPLEVFSLAVENITPVFWYIRIRRSGTWHKVPTGITKKKGVGRALKWLIEVSNDKKQSVPLQVQLATEILAAANYEGRVIAKKIELYKMCEANKGTAHFWWA